jgi:hypothetical protein
MSASAPEGLGKGGASNRRGGFWQAYRRVSARAQGLVKRPQSRL